MKKFKKAEQIPQKTPKLMPQALKKGEELEEYIKNLPKDDQHCRSPKYQMSRAMFSFSTTVPGQMIFTNCVVWVNYIRIPALPTTCNPIFCLAIIDNCLTSDQKSQSQTGH